MRTNLYPPVDVGVRVVGLLVWIKVFLDGSQQHPWVNSQQADERRLDDVVMKRIQQQRHSGEHTHDAVFLAAVKVVDDEHDAELTAV